MGFIRFIFSKQFLINLAIVAGLAIPAVGMLYFWLGHYTEHGITVATPDFTGVALKDIEAFADTTDIVYEIVDSLYSNELPKGAVADQEPKPGYRVKRGRKVYLTVNAILPKQVVIPDVRNLSLRQAKAVLESVGLKMGELRYVPDIAKNAVLDQQVGGRSVRKGMTAFTGTVVNLTLGDGLSNTRVSVPYLLYYTLAEATERLNLSSLNLATFKIDTPFTDTALVRVYKQIPAFNPNDLVPMGTSIILYLTEDTLSIQYDSTLYAAPLLLGDSLLTEEDLNDDDFE
jgi:beta-lactam-binding protein with PASTA domain